MSKKEYFGIPDEPYQTGTNCLNDAKFGINVAIVADLYNLLYNG